MIIGETIINAENKPPTLLTVKQEKFCLAYAETGNASEAYRRSYNASKMKQETIHVKASELMASGKVTVRVAELRAEAAERNKITVDRIIDELEDARRLAANAKIPQVSAMISASLGKAKLLGFFVDRIEQTTKNIGLTKAESERIINGMSKEERKLLKKLLELRAARS